MSYDDQAVEREHERHVAEVEGLRRDLRKAQEELLGEKYEHADTLDMVTALRAVLGRAAGVLREIGALGGEPEAKCGLCSGVGRVNQIEPNRPSVPCPDCKRQPPRED